MKTSLLRFIFFGTLIALLAVSCTNDELYPGGDGDKVAVRISAGVGGLQDPGSGEVQGSTRATNDSWNDGDVIGVTMVTPQAFDIINPYRNFGYTTTGDGQFAPNDAGKIIYFPTDDKEVTFRAYYPYKKDLASNVMIPVSTKDQSSLPEIDLMTAEHLSGTSTANPNVKLHFYHRLAKVVVNLTTDEKNEQILDDVQLVIKGLKTEASYDLLNEALIVDNNRSDENVAIPVQNAIGEGIILPRLPGEGVEFEVTTADGGKYTAALSSNFEFKAGYIHTFHIRLKSPAEISATIEPWIDGPERQKDVIRLVTGLGVTEGFEVDHELDLFLQEGAEAEFGLLRSFTYSGNNQWTPESPIYWESISGDPLVFRGATIMEDALNDTQMADILISKDVIVEPYTGVNLEMEHVGSKVTIVLQSSDGTFTTADLESASIVLPDYLNSGSYNEKGEFVPGTTRDDITPEDYVAIFPPQTVENGDNIVVVTINGREYEVVADEAEGFEYEKGTAYTLVLDASKAKVEMSAVVKPWEEETFEFNEIRVGPSSLGDNEGDLVDGDALYLFNGDDADRSALPGMFVYNEATDTWTYSGPSAPLYWEDIPNTGSIYGSITRPAISTAAENNQSLDYITAIPVENKGGTNNTSIHFQLSHQVAKVNVILRSSTYEENRLLNAAITLPDYAIGGRVDKGVYVPGSSLGPISLDKPTKNEEESVITYISAAYLQPQTIEIGEDLVTVVIDGDKHTYTVKPEDVKDMAAAAIEYEAGKVTNLIITIEKTGLNISTEITGWTELPALEFSDVLFFSVSNKTSTGFENDDQIKFYKLAADGASVDEETNTYVYNGGSDHGTLSPTGTPWYRDDFNTGDLISAVYPSAAPALNAGERTFDWTVKSSGVTNAHEDDILIAAPVADRNLGKIQANGDVEFEFKHVLSKVTINLIAGEGFTNDEVRPSVVEMNNFLLSGTIDVIEGTATPTGAATGAFNPTKLDQVYTLDGRTVVSSYEAFVMPQTITANTVMVTVKLNGAEFEVQLDADKLFAGGAHNMLNLTLNKTGVVLTASIVEWDVKPEIDLDLH